MKIQKHIQPEWFIFCVRIYTNSKALLVEILMETILNVKGYILQKD